MTLNGKWETVCRLCSEEKSEMVSIFGNEGLQRKIVQKLRACLPILVYKTDPLPKQICQFCAARLDDAYEFREYCLNVYKSMHCTLLEHRNVESVQIFFDAMRTSPDPCQAQLCRVRPRGPPPLVPIPATLPLENSSMPIDVTSEPQHNSCIETLTELPCEVEIKEMNTDPILMSDACELVDTKSNFLIENNNHFVEAVDDMIVEYESKHQNDKEEKRTSILEQVLTGSLTMNDRKELKPKEKLTSKWWCAPCNSYYKTRESLVKHLQLHCPRKYTCRKCPMSFESVEDLAKHGATDHLKVTLDFDKSVKECHQCDREFVSWEMLRQHRLRDHLSDSIENGTNTWCQPCNRFFPSIETYQSHMQLHQGNNTSVPSSLSIESITMTALRSEDSLQEMKKEHFPESTKSLTCPTCGKVCTQQSALSNHMRTHEPKRHKCDICGRSFGLFIRLAAHRMSEHNQHSAMIPVTASVEQEEALNAEREAREAREAKTRSVRQRTYFEVSENKDNVINEDEPPTKRSATSNPNVSKNVARCGICLQWFNDHTTMLTHLQTHSDSHTCKSYTCHLCKKSFKEKWQLFRHDMSHKRGDSSSMYTCNVCSKTFTDKTLFKSHQKSHVVDKTYHCSKCNKLFFKEVSLLTHQCTGEPLFSKKAAPSKSAEKAPSLNNSKRYTCAKCNVTFSTSQSRNSHMKMHEREDFQVTMQMQKDVKKEVEEDDDGMPTLRPETSLEYDVPHIEPKVEINEESAPPPLKRTLIRTSSGYRCGVCQSPFVSRELAIAHLRSAHPVMPYQCPYCKKRFTTQYTFTHHIKTEHPDEPEK